MKARLSEITRVSFLLIPMLLVTAVAAGCTGNAWSSIDVGTTSRDAALRAMGPQAVETPEGLTLETEHWPTAIEVIHVSAAPDGAVQWKLSYRGAVTHFMVSQLVSTDVHYEGPLPEDLLRAMRMPESMDDSDFVEGLLGFLKSRIDESSTENWTDLQRVRNDKYRSRFLGLMNVTMASLSGQGRLQRDAYSASIRGAKPGSLELEHLGPDKYRITVNGSATLGPLPVL